MTPRLFLALLLWLPALATADLVGIDIGRGNHNSKPSNAVFLRYARDLLMWHDMPIYGEFLAGRWDGDHENQAFSIGLGARYPFTPRWSLIGSAGIGYVENRNAYLGTHPQFVFRFGINYRIGRTEFSLTQRHYSNGKGLFQWEGTNVGENFIMFGFAWDFGRRPSDPTEGVGLRQPPADDGARAFRGFLQ